MAISASYLQLLENMEKIFLGLQKKPLDKNLVLHDKTSQINYALRWLSDAHFYIQKNLDPEVQFSPDPSGYILTTKTGDVQWVFIENDYSRYEYSIWVHPTLQHVVF